MTFKKKKKKKNLIIRNLGIKENHWLKCKRANLSSDYISSKRVFMVILSINAFLKALLLQEAK